MSIFVVTFHGDLPRYGHQDRCFYTLEEALSYLGGIWGEKRNDAGFSGDEEAYATPDPEDDRILVWECSPPWMKVVWHFSGWHWSYDASDVVGGPLDQGKLPGHETSLYELAMVNY